MVQVRTSFRQEQVNRTKKSSYVNNEITSNISKIAFVKGDKNDQNRKLTLTFSPQRLKPALHVVDVPCGWEVGQIVRSIARIMTSLPVEVAVAP